MKNKLWYDSLPSPFVNDQYRNIMKGKKTVKSCSANLKAFSENIRVNNLAKFQEGFIYISSIVYWKGYYEQTLV
jgi:hypothetical protein